MHNYVPSHRIGLTSRYYDVEKLAKLAKTATYLYIHVISMTMFFIFACYLFIVQKLRNYCKKKITIFLEFPSEY
jgi:hypothetical protein